MNVSVNKQGGKPGADTSMESPDVKHGSDSIKRYNLALPEELYNQLQQVAKQRHVTVLELLRRFIKLGLIATEVEGKSGSALLIREGTREREIMLV